MNCLLVANLVFLVASLPGSSAGGPHSFLPVASQGRSAIVSLFEWRFDDIAEECERYLGPGGFAAVQVSPVLEYAVLKGRPWWERYQPVSYKIASRSGDEAGFANMADRCNRAGVRVIVDVLPNHMSGDYLEGVGTGGSHFNGKTQSYPAVPYEARHFHSRDMCSTNNGLVQGHDDANQVRNCKLIALNDLDTSQEYVIQKIRNAYNHLIRLGAAGFRFDSAKNIAPEEIGRILQGLDNLSPRWFHPHTRPFIYNQVLEGGPIKSYQYAHLGRVQGYDYRRSLRDVFRQQNNQRLAWLKNFGEGWDFVVSNDALVMVDNHDLQRSEPLTGLNFRDPKLLKLSTAFMLAWPYGIPNIMSSYSWPLRMEGGADRNSVQGPPAEGNGEIKRVIRRHDGSCDGGWVCEHRWNEIARMITWRRVAEGHPVTNWWDNGNNQIAFGRGRNAFIVINNEDEDLEITLQTGLPAGEYCDIISGSGQDGVCTGKKITVNHDGFAHFDIDDDDQIPMIAIHVRPW